MKMFNFDAAALVRRYDEKGYVHIRGGLTDEFLQTLKKQAAESLQESTLMKNFAIGDKQQAMYQFPVADGYEQLLDMTAGVTGLDRQRILLSERHFKAYETTAIPDPPPHKDRFASEVSVGLSINVPEGSTLVLYPEDYLAMNQFNSSTELNASFSPERKPIHYFKNAKRVEINDKPGDVIVFRGNKIWHLRARPAGTAMLYLKLNTYNCDVLGEDPRTTSVRELTQQLLLGPDSNLEKMIPQIGRRVDYIHRRFDRHFHETLGVVLWGEKHFSIDEPELRALKAIDGRKTVLEIARQLGEDITVPDAVSRIRRLATRGILDLSGVPVAGNVEKTRAQAVTAGV